MFLEVEDGTELHDHRAAGPVEVGHLQHHLLASRGGDDPLGHALAQAIEDVAKSAGLVTALGTEPSLAQRGLYRVGGGLDAALFVAEDVDVLGEPVDDPVSDQRVTAAQGEPVRGGGAKRDGGYLAVELADRHQAALRGAAAAARRAECLSSHACRTPLGRYRSGQRAISVSPSRWAVRSSRRLASRSTIW